MQGRNDQMARNGGPDGNGGRLAVPNLTNGDDIRVLPQNGAQTGSEGHAGFLIDLALVGAGDIILHRVFQGHDVGLLVAQLLDHGAHGGGLTGTGGAHDQDDAGAVFQQAVIFLLVLPFQTDGLPVDMAGGLVQQTQNDLLAVNGGDGGNTQVDFLILGGDHGPAVLGDLPLGNVHAAHNFQSGDDRCLQIGGDGKNPAQHAVDAHPHHHLPLLGLQMDIGSALGNGPLDDGIDKADGGGFGSAVVHGLGHLHGDDIRLIRTGLPLHLLNGPGSALVAIEGGNGLLHGPAGGDHGHHLLVRGGLDLLLGFEVQGVAHGHIQLVLLELHGDDAIFLCNGPGHEPGQLQGDGHGGQIHKVHAKLHLQRLNELLLCNDAVIDEHVAQALSGLLLNGQGIVQLLRTDDACRDQQVTQSHICHR